MKPHWSVILAWVICGARLCSGEGSAPLIVVPVIPGQAPKVDGRIAEEPFWKSAADLGAFMRADGYGLPAAATRARLARTGDTLYIAADCQEPRMDRLVATKMGRDAELWTDDCIEVFIQRPGAKYLHFIINALGAQFDEQEKDSGWNGEWEAGASRGKTGWSVEIGLPWKTLGGPPREGDIWRLNICRSRRAEAETSAWSPTGGGFHVPERFGEIAFLQAPWPADVEWNLVSRTQGQVRVKWLPADLGSPIAMKVNGTSTDGEFKIAQEGLASFWMTATWQGRDILRSGWAVVIAPLSTTFASAKARLESLPTEVQGMTAIRASLLSQLNSLRAVAESASPALSEELVRQAERIEVQASYLAVKAAVLQKQAKVGAIVYGVETSLKKLLRHKPFEGQPGGVVQLDAARREMDAAQVVVFAFEAPLLLVSAHVDDLKSTQGDILPAAAIRIRRVGYVPTVKPSYKVDFVGLWPDPLMPASPFDVAAGEFESLWVDVRVPAETKPGVYRSSLTLKAMNAPPTIVPLEVRVRSFTIPQRPSLVTAFGLNPSWRVKQDTDAFIRNALEHRISPYGVGAPKLVKAPAMDWSKAQRLEVEVSSDGPGSLTLVIVPAEGRPRSLGPRPVAAGAAQRVVFDLTDVRGLVRSWRLSLPGPVRARLTAKLVTESGSKVLADGQEKAAVVGKDGWLESWPAWEGSGWDYPDSSPVWDWTEFDDKVAKYLPLGLTGHVAGIREPRAAWAREWERHLGEKGWLDLAYTYLFDEPEPKDYPRLNDVMGEVKRAAPGLRNMMTARAFPPELHYVDIWCPEVFSFDPQAAREEQARGRAVWWYVAFSTRHPYPNVWIDYPALDCRIWPWMTWKHDLDGMLYWSATYWSRNDPWQCAESFPGANGDGSLMYPGEDGQPVDSIRWECLRDGLEDYEVLCLLDAGARELEAKGAAPELVKKARALVAIDDGVVKSYKEYNPNPSALLRARKEMSDVLEQVVTALGREPKIEGRPRRRRGVDLASVPLEMPEAAASASVGPFQAPPLQAEDGLVLRYSFEDDAPFAFDVSGNGMHGIVRQAKRVEGAIGKGLQFGEKSAVILPAGVSLLGAMPEAGSIAVWAKPNFDPQDLATDLYAGYHVAFYVMETDGNGLPDGFDEIGVYVHGPRLYARCAGQAGAFASIRSPLRRGEWTHLCLTWTKDRRALYVNGNVAAEAKGMFPLPRLDGFPGRLGNHPASGRWSWAGELDEFRVYRRCLSEAEVAALARR